MLLCGVLGKARSIKPLTQSEYNRVARWLIGEKMRPADLLRYENVDLAAINSGIELQRLKSLLGRGVQLGFAVEEWQQNGIWVLSRSDRDYPARYKKHLKNEAPPLLFGVGDRSLLQGGGVAIVGSRNVDGDGEDFARKVAELCAYNRMPVVSGGARGVDQIAMTAALDAGGVVIGVLAENLLRRSLERNARRAISDDQLLLISPYRPDARFTVGTAMGRNKLIYAMADYGLVVSAEYKKGGTWAGAVEELKRENPLPVFVRSGANVPVGNTELLCSGALEYQEVKYREELGQHLADLAKIVKGQEQAQIDRSGKDEKQGVLPIGPTMDSSAVAPGPGIYETVLPVIIDHLGSPTASGELSKTLDVSKAQLYRWLRKAVDEGRIQKLLSPVRYQVIEAEPETIYEAVLPVIIAHLGSSTAVDELSKALDVSKAQLNHWLKKAVDEERIRKLSQPVRYQAMEAAQTTICEAVSPVIISHQTIYEAVLPMIIAHLGSPTAPGELSKTLDVSKVQLNSWLKKAVDEGRIQKLSQPVRYQAMAAEPTTIYEAVLPVIIAHLGSSTAVDELSKTLDVLKVQLNSWLKKAVNEGRI